MKYAVLSMIAAYALIATVACSSKNSHSDGDSSNLDCPSGTTFYMGYCVNGNGQTVNTGSVAFQSKVTSNSYGSPYSTAGALSITNRNVYNQLLREGFGICDQGSYNGGSASCMNFTNFMVSIQATHTEASSARVTLEAYPTYNYGGSNYWISTPSWQQAGTCALTSFFFGGCYMTPNQYQNQWYHSNVLPLNASHSITNENQGFEMRAYGATGTISQNKLIQLIVLNGSLKNQSFDYYLAYNGKAGGVFAQGKMVRCNTPSCGLW